MKRLRLHKVILTCLEVRAAQVLKTRYMLAEEKCPIQEYFLTAKFVPERYTVTDIYSPVIIHSVRGPHPLYFNEECTIEARVVPKQQCMDFSNIQIGDAPSDFLGLHLNTGYFVNCEGRCGIDCPNCNTVPPVPCPECEWPHCRAGDGITICVNELHQCCFCP